MGHLWLPPCPYIKQKQRTCVHKIKTWKLQQWHVNDFEWKNSWKWTKQNEMLTTKRLNSYLFLLSGDIPQVTTKERRAIRKRWTWREHPSLHLHDFQCGQPKVTPNSFTEIVPPLLQQSTKKASLLRSPVLIDKKVPCKLGFVFIYQFIRCNFKSLVWVKFTKICGTNWQVTGEPLPKSTRENGRHCSLELPQRSNIFPRLL